MSGNTSLAEYLKRYTSDSADDKKKKKKKKLKKFVIASRSRIVDDDVDFSSTLPDNSEVTLDDFVGDNDPVVAAIIDERPEHIQQLEKFRDSDGKWKTLKEEEEYRKRHKRHDSDSDESFAKRVRHDSDSDQSPLRKQRHDSDSDQSSPRKQRHDSDSDQSPQRKQRYDSDSDKSPPRKKRHYSDSDQSPPRKQRHDSDSDQSPPRRGRHGSDSDQSPPRKGKHQSDSSNSLHKKNKKIETNNKEKSKSDRLKKSRWNNSDSDQSPPRSNKSSSKEKEEKMTKTLSGKMAGLSSAMQMKAEAQILKKKEEIAFKRIGDEQLGKHAKTVFRDKSGKRRNLEQEKEENEEKAAKVAEKNAKYKAWGAGLKQQADKESRVMDHVHEMSKPMARYRDDEDLDNMLKEQDREGDPMLAFIKKKKKGAAKVKELPKYKGPPPPPNRYGIRPGYRWDGVNRTNGFEKKLFSHRSNKKATAEHAYKWSIEDM